MKKILSIFAFALLLSLPLTTKGADEAVFSATSTKTQYNVGDEIIVSFSVDAGTYSSTLNTIDMDIKLSDATVINPTDETSPFTAGSIFSTIPIQSYTDGLANVVIYIDPNNKPSTRSGLIGTMTFKAQKVGKVTISYDRIEAAHDKSDIEFADSSASSLILEVVDSSSATTDTTASTTTSGTSGTGGTVVYGSGATTVATATPYVTTTTATTGPEHVAIAVLGGSIIALLVTSWYRKTKYYPNI